MHSTLTAYSRRTGMKQCRAHKAEWHTKFALPAGTWTDAKLATGWYRTQSQDRNTGNDDDDDAESMKQVENYITSGKQVRQTRGRQLFRADRKRYIKLQ